MIPLLAMLPMSALGDTRNLLEMGENEALVDAKVTRIDASGKDRRITLEITGIRCAEGVAVGDTVIASALPTETTNALWYIDPSPAVGEEGIWLVRKVRGQLVADRTNVKLPFPARKGVSSRYEQARELADAMHKVFTAAPAQLPEEINVLVRSQTPEVAVVGVRALAKHNPAALRHLAATNEKESTLSVAAQVTLEEALAEVSARDPALKASSTRLALLKRSIGAAQEPFESGVVARRLSFLVQHPDLPNAELLSLLSDFFFQESIPSVERIQLIGSMSLAIERRNLEGASGLVKTVADESKDPALKREARRLLEYLATRGADVKKGGSERPNKGSDESGSRTE